MAGCISKEMLTRFLEDQLEGGPHSAIVDHVESCEACQEHLTDLTGDCSVFRGWEPIPLLCIGTLGWHLSSRLYAVSLNFSLRVW